MVGGANIFPIRNYMIKSKYLKPPLFRIDQI